MNLKKSLPLFLSLILFISCRHEPTDLEILLRSEGQFKTQGGYDSYLALEYLGFARNLFAIKDEKTAKHFAKKGRAVGRGEEVVPENPITWKADPVQIEEMVMMQKRLESVLITPHIKFYLPIQTAHLTYLYDCWISRESQAVFRAQELAQCRTRFVKLLDEIERYIDDSKKDKSPKVEIRQTEFERFEILFDFNIFKFNDKANKDLVSTLKYLKTLDGNYRILLVGNADRVGAELYNQNLALNRANTVKNYLVKNGVPEELVEMRSVGEDFPDIITQDGMQQQNNRTVGIYVLKGYGTFMTFPLPLIENYVYRKEIERARKERGLE